MTAPSPTARVTPSGRRLGDGHPTKVTFAADTNIELWETSVTPPGIEGDDPNENATMHSSAWRTKSPRALKTMTDMTFTAQYDPVVYNSVAALVNVPTTVTVTFPDGSTLAFYGFLKAFAPNELTEGTQPDAEITVVPTNMDPTTCAEEGPVYTAGSGTSSSC